mmetsp:Transcript_104147/g.335829  ORF Transcript_104147/g.335829 Transcript_104147/m.335829 type:complete len:217 (-) Transcript_104147:1972-2622(-)
MRLGRAGCPPVARAGGGVGRHGRRAGDSGHARDGAARVGSEDAMLRLLGQPCHPALGHRVFLCSHLGRGLRPAKPCAGGASRAEVAGGVPARWLWEPPLLVHGKQPALPVALVPALPARNVAALIIFGAVSAIGAGRARVRVLCIGDQQLVVTQRCGAVQRRTFNGRQPPQGGQVSFTVATATVYPAVPQLVGRARLLSTFEQPPTICELVQVGVS